MNSIYFVPVEANASQRHLHRIAKKNEGIEYQGIINAQAEAGLSAERKTAVFSVHVGEPQLRFRRLFPHCTLDVPTGLSKFGKNFLTSRLSGDD